MTNIDLSPTDRAILEMLREGRATPAYIATETDYSRQHVRNRLQRLTEHGYVTRLHKGLYELADDPEQG
jgi:DNA-binding IclR family transcriptional regulator